MKKIIRLQYKNPHLNQNLKHMFCIWNVFDKLMVGGGGGLGPLTWICKQLGPKWYSGLTKPQLIRLKKTYLLYKKVSSAYFPTTISREHNFFNLRSFNYQNFATFQIFWCKIELIEKIKILFASACFSNIWP